MFHSNWLIHPTSAEALTESPVVIYSVPCPKGVPGIGVRRLLVFWSFVEIVPLEVTEVPEVKVVPLIVLDATRRVVGVPRGAARLVRPCPTDCAVVGALKVDEVVHFVLLQGALMEH